MLLSIAPQFVRLNRLMKSARMVNLEEAFWTHGSEYVLATPALTLKYPGLRKVLAPCVLSTGAVPAPVGSVQVTLLKAPVSDTCLRENPFLCAPAEGVG